VAMIYVNSKMHSHPQYCRNCSNPPQKAAGARSVEKGAKAPSPQKGSRASSSGSRAAAREVEPAGGMNVNGSRTRSEQRGHDGPSAGPGLPAGRGQGPAPITRCAALCGTTASQAAGMASILVAATHTDEACALAIKQPPSQNNPAGTPPGQVLRAPAPGRLLPR
jgi:hypothetical protein